MGKKTAPECVEIDMAKGNQKEIAARIGKHSENGTLEVRLLFPDVWNADTYCLSGRLPILEKPPVHLLLYSLASNYNQLYSCSYKSGDSHAVLEPLMKKER
ncbi:MAG: hypothetical protein PHC66_01990 [Candidatus Nanoarchaeia archaeon]|nr:hypothetical protein [Candidatus Nanoarchaeia archaeon]MDD5239059.1 hypothetical protein [Candidatus Nanoarchaeia archaeon]